MKVSFRYGDQLPGQRRLLLRYLANYLERHLRGTEDAVATLKQDALFHRRGAFTPCRQQRIGNVSLRIEERTDHGDGTGEFRTTDFNVGDPYA